jgi:phytoene/squalene synthetase
MPADPRALDQSYRVRAVPAASPRYWSWLFAAPEMRDGLLGIYALLAEWRALTDPGLELASAHLKLAWWRDEIERLKRASPVHPISRYLAALPRAGAVDWRPLERSLEATARHIGGAPLEHGAELEAHAAALCAGPLALAAQLASARPPDAAEDCGCCDAATNRGFLQLSDQPAKRLR